MSRFFIDRPIFAIVVALLLVIIGAIAGFSLPIAQYPQISPPTVSVQTNGFRPELPLSVPRC